MSNIYINKIDELIDLQFDKINDQLLDNKIFKKIIDSNDFSQYFKDINNFINSFIEQQEVSKIIKIKQNIDYIVKIIQKYIGIYIFLLIGNLNTKANFVDNIIAINKNNETSHNLDFLYTVNNISVIIDLHNFIINLQNLIKKNDISSSKFLSEFGNDFVNNYLKDSIHNLIKTVVFKEVYLKQDKEKLFNIIREIEENSFEFKYINIVVPKSDYLDKTVVDNVFARHSNTIYNFIHESSEEKVLSNEDKINLLFKKKLIIPIVDDFLRYNKISTTSTFYIDYAKDDVTKNDSKIKYIVTQINKLVDLHNFSDKEQKELKQNFNNSIIEKKALIINDIEEIFIIDKLEKSGKKTIERSEFFLDLINYRIYPFINFKYTDPNSFTQTLDNHITVLRAIDFVRNVKEKPNNFIQTRMSHDKLNIIGIVIPNFEYFQTKIDLFCKKISTIVNVSTIGDVKNNYDNVANFLLKNNFFKNKQFIYWLFNEKTDVIKLKEFINISNFNYFQNAIVALYDIYEKIFLEHFEDLIKKQKFISVNKVMPLIDKFQDKFIQINEIEYFKLQKLLFYSYQVKIKEPEEVKYSIGKIKLINNKVPKFEKKLIIVDYDKRERDTSMDIYSDAICQHFIDFANMKKLDINLFNQLFIFFYKNYIEVNKEGNFICKSCGTYIDLQNFVVDFDSQYGAENLTITLTSPLEEVKAYEKFSGIIRLLQKIIEQIGIITNSLDFVGKTLINKINRQNIIKESIDVIKFIYKTNKINLTTYMEKFYSDKYNISPNHSNYLLFFLSSKIYDTKEKDTLKSIKHNNIIATIVFTLINKSTEKTIKLLSFDKICNYFLFEKFGIKLFEKLQIIINDHNKTVPILNYPILCFLIYYFSCILIKYQIWDSEKSKTFDIGIQKNIIHTIINILNSIVFSYNINKNNYSLQVYATRYFINLNSIFRNKKLAEYLSNKIKKRIRFHDNKISYIVHNIPATIIENHVTLLSDYTNIIPIKTFITKYYVSKLLKPFIYSDQDYYKFLGYNYKDKYLQKLKSFYKDLNLREKYKLSLNEKFVKNNKNLEKRQNLVLDSYFNFYDILLKDFNKINFKNFVNSFFDTIHNFVGNHVNVHNYLTEQSELVYLTSDVYMINHDQYGNKIEKPFMITPNFSDGKISYLNKNTNSEVFYDSTNFNLLGYKAKDMFHKIISNNYLILRKSFKSMLLNLDSVLVIKNFIYFVKKVFNQIYYNHKTYEGLFSLIIKKYETKFKDVKYLNKVLLDMFEHLDYKKEVLIYYFINEINTLLDKNNDKYYKTVIIYLLLDLIHYYYVTQSSDIKSYELNIFKYALETERLEEQTIQDNVADLTEQELEELEEKTMDDVGETEGYDLQQDEDVNSDIDEDDTFHKDGD